MRRNYDFTMILFIGILIANWFRNGAISDPMGWLMDILMMLPAVIVGLSFHEYSHALVSHKLGDPTPKQQGRLTINPMAHIDLVGLIALVLAGFGWGKPVEVNTAYYANKRKGEIMVSLAGVVMNLIIAVLFSVIAKVLLLTLGPSILSTGGGYVLWEMIMYMIQMNLILMVFNLVPCPPLDGFNIVAETFHLKDTGIYWTVVKYGYWIMLLLILTGILQKFISPIIFGFFGILQSYIIF